MDARATRSVLEEMEGHRLYPAFLLAANTGIRMLTRPPRSYANVFREADAPTWARDRILIRQSRSCGSRRRRLTRRTAATNGGRGGGGPSTDACD